MIKKYKNMLYSVVALCTLITACSPIESINLLEQHNKIETVQSENSIRSIIEIPEFTEEPFVILNNNQPDFGDITLVDGSFEFYNDLDALGRCGVAEANIGIDIMPTEERGSIGQIKPTGWQTVKYDFIDGKYLYNRCHLIGFQLAGENANEKNLITGTRYMNVEGMLPFENMVADYVKETENHVYYRATPIYDGDNLIVKGVQLEEKSVEDNEEGICFNVFCYNVQPGVFIDYSTGENEEDKSVSDEDSNSVMEESVFILNTNSKKFHTIDCSSIKKIKADNKKEYSGNSNDLVHAGYSACGICNP